MNSHCSIVFPRGSYPWFCSSIATVLCKYLAIRLCKNIASNRPVLVEFKSNAFRKIKLFLSPNFLFRKIFRIVQCPRVFNFQ